MSMVERVARAIEEARDEYLPDPAAMARAAIEAMREPTDAMVAALPEQIGHWPPDIVWIAMIDEALK